MNKWVKRAITLGVCSVGAVASIISNEQTNGTLKYPVQYSAEAMELLTGKWEDCRTKRYKDTGSLDTVGIGHLCDKYTPTGTLTLEQIAELFNKDIYIAEKCVVDNFNGNSLTKGQREALTDFVFNVGCSKASENKNGQMTRIRTYALTGQYGKMCDEFLHWAYGRNVKGEMVRIKGLYNRRLDEQKWCKK